MRSEPQFQQVKPGAGHYESFFIKACHPTDPLGVWIRHTVHKAPAQPPVGSVWFTLFDASAGRPLASKVTPPPSELGVGVGEYIHVADSRLEDGRAVGSARSAQLDASWELRFASAEPPYRHLPPWMYRAPIPRTKLLSPYPAAVFDGVINAGERTIEVAGWPGMIGHNWGTQHAERWIWLHGARFAEEPEAWFDAGLGRLKVGPLTTPWIANAMISLGVERHVLGGLGRELATKVRESPTRLAFTLPGKDLTVRGEVGSEASNFVGWVYSDPDGSQHNTVNCSIADMTLTLAKAGQPDRVLRVAGGATYELGMRETDHGIPLAPFSDP